MNIIETKTTGNNVTTLSGTTGSYKVLTTGRRGNRSETILKGVATFKTKPAAAKAYSAHVEKFH